VPNSASTLPGRSPGTPEIALAGTCGDVSSIEDHLVAIARLTTGRVEPVSYASVTALRIGASTTVATSSDIALAVDLAQYADAAGPCLDTLNSGRAVSVPDIGAAMAWPGYRDMAWRLGVRASLSIPLFAAGGTPIAALNLYGHDPDSMALLTRGVRTVYHVNPTENGQLPQPLDAGSEQLITGLVAALQVRELIQQALGVVLGRGYKPARTGYLVLRARAADTGDGGPPVAVGGGGRVPLQ
jgi:hypothetical protein